MCSLKQLIISGCKNFESLPEFGECMKNLSKLFLSCTSIRELPMSLGCLVGLENLSLWGCEDLVCLPDAIGELKSLKQLDVEGCYRLRRLPPSVSRLPLLRTLNLGYCGLTEGSFPHDFCHFSSLTNLYLCGNDFISVPISIHKLHKLRCLSLNNCKRLQFLPELPSSIRALEAWGCNMLNTSDSNILSEVCNVFKPPSRQDHAPIFRMMITREEIPSWFVHRQDGNHISVPNPSNYPRNERMGIALCFLLHKLGYNWTPVKLSLSRNGNKFSTRWSSYNMGPGYYLYYILCLNIDHLSDEFRGDNHFELSTKRGYLPDDLSNDDLSNDDLFGDVESTNAKILKSTARWVCIEDLNKVKLKDPRNKRQ